MIHNAQHTEMQDYKTSEVTAQVISDFHNVVASGLLFHIHNHIDAGERFFIRIAHRSQS
ncbi:MAG: hypothetical protein ABIQ02_05730 [Saprospiraceae bacterium]